MLATQYIRILLCTLITMCVPYYAEENMNDQLYNVVLQVWCFVLVFGKNLPEK